MSALNLSMREPAFRLTYRVIYGDTDAGGIVYNANYLRLFEMGRTEMMRAHALPYSTIEDRGLILPVTETYLRYKAPARYDDLVAIDTCLVEVKRFSCRFNYRIIRPGDTDREQLLVKGFTVHACINRQGKLTPIPEDVCQAMMELCGQGEQVP